MSTLRTLVLLAINYLPIFLWMALFRQGPLSVLMLFPVVLICGALDVMLTHDKKGLLFWAINLIVSCSVGAALQAYLIIRYVDSGLYNILAMLLEIFLFSLLILIAAKLTGRMKPDKYIPPAPKKVKRGDEDNEDDDYGDERRYEDDSDEDDEESDGADFTRRGAKRAFKLPWRR